MGKELPPSRELNLTVCYPWRGRSREASAGETLPRLLYSLAYKEDYSSSTKTQPSADSTPGMNSLLLVLLVPIAHVGPDIKTEQPQTKSTHAAEDTKYGKEGNAARQ